jgi:serine/threonine protein kinase
MDFPHPTSLDFHQGNVRLITSQPTHNNMHKVILEQGRFQFFAITDALLHSLHITDPYKWHTPPRRIDIDRIYPTVAPNILPSPLPSPLTIYGSEPLEPSYKVYIKRPNLFALAEGLFNCDQSMRTTNREIASCEVLHANPHPSICDYLGVVLHSDSMRITGLAFERFAFDLEKLVRSGRCFNAESCMSQIEAGLDHMHALGLVHSDLKPANIFVSYDLKRFVIGDFNSTHVRGQRLEQKIGTKGWTLDRFEYAHREIDFHGLSLIRYWLECKGWGAPQVGEEYMSTSQILDGNAASMSCEDESSGLDNMHGVEVEGEGQCGKRHGLCAVEKYNREAGCNLDYGGGDKSMGETF